MDKVLNRPIFRNTYLKTIKKPISNFSKGGIAALGVRNYKLGGDVTGFTPEDTQNLVNYTIAGQLLQGVRQPGQSQASALLSNLGSGLEKSIPVTMEAKKLNIEAGTKNVPNLIDVYNTETKQIEKVPDRVVYSDYLNNEKNKAEGTASSPKYLAPPSATDLQSKRMYMDEANKKDADLAVDSHNKLINAASTSNMIEDLKKVIPDSYTGKAMDWDLAAKNYIGSAKQVLNIDPAVDPNGYDNYATVKKYIDDTNPDKTQQAKTLLTNLTYSTARNFSAGQRLNQQEIKSAYESFGASGDKKLFLDGINRTQKNLLDNAMLNYNAYHTGSIPGVNDNLLEKAQQNITTNGVTQNTLRDPFAIVQLHSENAGNYLNRGKATDTTNTGIFGPGAKVNPNLYGTPTQTNTKPDAFNPANVFGVKPVTVNPITQ